MSSPSSSRHLDTLGSEPSLMRLSWRIAVCATAALFLMISLVDAAVPAPQALPGPIVDAGWLSQNLDNVAVLDVRMDSRTFVEEGHIPTARLIEWRLVRSSRMEDGFMLDDMLPERAAFRSCPRQWCSKPVMA